MYMRLAISGFPSNRGLSDSEIEPVSTSFWDPLPLLTGVRLSSIGSGGSLVRSEVLSFGFVVPLEEDMLRCSLVRV